MIRLITIFLIFQLSVTLLFAQTEKGQASYYADKFNGRTTANGEIFDNSKLTAAHNTLPFNSLVKVTNLNNGKSIIVRINDRGPFVKGRIIDLSKAAAAELNMLVSGVAAVEVELIKNEEADNRVTRGNFTLTFSQNRT